MKTRSMINVAMLFSLLAIVVAAGPSLALAEERVDVPGGSYINVSPAELRAMLDRKDFFFVNVHVPYEGEIERTDAFVPFTEVEKQLHLFPQARDARILLYCRTGRMSDIAAREMVRLGYTNLWHLKGGFVAWEKAGYLLIGGKP